LHVSTVTPASPVPLLLVTRPEMVRAPQAASATHWDWLWQLAGVQVRVCWRWFDAQPPAPQLPLVQAVQEHGVYVIESYAACHV